MSSLLSNGIQTRDEEISCANPTSKLHRYAVVALKVHCSHHNDHLSRRTSHAGNSCKKLPVPSRLLDLCHHQLSVGLRPLKSSSVTFEKSRPNENDLSLSRAKLQHGMTKYIPIDISWTNTLTLGDVARDACIPCRLLHPR